MTKRERARIEVMEDYKYLKALHAQALDFTMKAFYETWMNNLLRKETHESR